MGGALLTCFLMFMATPVSAAAFSYPSSNSSEYSKSLVDFPTYELAEDYTTLSFDKNKVKTINNPSLPIHTIPNLGGKWGRHFHLDIKAGTHQYGTDATFRQDKFINIRGIYYSQVVTILETKCDIDCGIVTADGQGFTMLGTWSEFAKNLNSYPYAKSYTTPLYIHYNISLVNSETGEFLHDEDLWGQFFDLDEAGHGVIGEAVSINSNLTKENTKVSIRTKAGHTKTCLYRKPNTGMITGKNYLNDKDGNNNTLIHTDSEIKNGKFEVKTLGLTGLGSGIKFSLPKYNVRYIAKEGGSITGIKNETIQKYNNPKGTSYSINKGYISKSWVADQDLYDNFGNFYPKGTRISDDKISNLQIEKDTKFTISFENKGSIKIVKKN